MDLHSPWLLLAAIPLVLAATAAMRHRRGGYVLASTAGFGATRPTFRLRLARLLPLLHILAALLIVFGLARPRVADAESEVPAEGVDIVISLDLSSSMASTRFGSGSRLDGARDVISDFVTSREEDRVGLVIFQRDALPFAPLTRDHEALANMIEDLDTGIVPDGTAIGDGIATSVNMLRESPAASRVIVLLTDGQHNTRSIHPEDAAALAEAMRIRLYTIGMTSSRAPSAEIDDTMLEVIAERTGGRYFAASEPEELEEVYTEIASLEKSRVPGERFEVYREFGHWFVLGGAGLLGVAVLLGATWLRRSSA